MVTSSSATTTWVSLSPSAVRRAAARDSARDVISVLNASVESGDFRREGPPRIQVGPFTVRHRVLACNGVGAPDLVLQLDDAVEQRLRRRRAARDVDAH